ncbi:MAG: hypothetical protein LBI03_09140 [Clostridiales bacterium]|jgi:replicative DNA helicase|nr:hypothetical protein [Clostridiales bacterium]
MFYIEQLDKIGITLPKRLAIIGGFSGGFKTTLGINIVYNNAINLGYYCCFLSLEMEEDEIMTRLLVRHAQHNKFKKYNCVITLDKVNKNNLTPVEKEFLLYTVAHDLKNNSRGKIIVLGPEDIPEIIQEGFDSFISKIDQKLSPLFSNSKMKYLHLLIIDYIQLLARFSRNLFPGISDPYQVVAHIVRQLRYITHAHNNGEGISIIALSQLNRASYLSVKERLRKFKQHNIYQDKKYENLFDLTSLSESSEIVNAADIVLTVYSDDFLKKGKRAVIQLLKNRFGETIEDGIEVHALPEISYIGDFKQEDSGCPSAQEEMAIFINNLLNGSI